jgi:signal transduction histidine kinase
MDNSNQVEDLQQVNATLTQDLEKVNFAMEEVQQRFQQQSKLAAIGQLTAGILHEIRNPLNFVNNFSRLSISLLDELKEITATPETMDLEELNELLDMVETNINRILENGSRAERIVQSMLAQTRTDETAFAPTDLNQLVDEFSKLAYQGVRGQEKTFNVKLTFQLDPAMGEVNIRSNEFTRVIINLVNNACYAVNVKKLANKIEGYVPEITISTKREEDNIEIRIKDNGTGISEESQKKIFSPFFTTKPVGEGTGLGLALSLTTINELHKGELSVESEKDLYTEFIVRIPSKLE